MSIFETIFQEMLNIKNNEKNKKNKKQLVPKMFLFLHYFTPSNFSNRDSLTWQKYIKYKYFILTNYLHVNKNNLIDNEVKDEILQLFSTTQKRVMALYRFKDVCIRKTKKYLDDPQDLQFNLLSEMPKKHTMDIIQVGIRYQFSIFDLIRIINTSLSYEYNFFTDPKKIKNPWNNNPFSIATLYNIYFFIRHSTIGMPILLDRFFQSNFNLDMFERHNQLIIKNYIIENCQNFSKMKKLSHIYNMIDTFNKKRLRCQIKIDSGFPENRLLEVMEPYLKTYLLSVYSYEDDLLIKYRSILVTKLRQFNKMNPIFGRKIINLKVRKLYYISCLHYNEDTLLFIPCNIYLPKPSMISLKGKCYYIDYFHQEKYTVFPSFENSTNAKNINYNTPKTDMIGLFDLTKNYTFTDKQIDILKEKYYPIVSQQIQNINLDLDVESNNNMMVDSETDIDSDVDSNVDLDVDSDVDSNVDSNVDSDVDSDVESNNIINNGHYDDDDDDDDDDSDDETNDGVDVNLDDGNYTNVDDELNNQVNNATSIIEENIEPYTTVHVESFTLNDMGDRELNRLIELLNINDLLADDDDEL
jgi:hypothetical protein